MISLDFGNGFTAGGRSSDTVRIIEHSGLDFPELSVALFENSNIDGGRIGATRSKCRRMMVVLEFATATKDQVAAAFMPVIRNIFDPIGQRLLTSHHASGDRFITYHVEALSFLSVNENTPLRAQVSLISKNAYAYGTAIASDWVGGTQTFTVVGNAPAPLKVDVEAPAAGDPDDIRILLDDTSITNPYRDTYITGPWTATQLVQVESETFEVITDGNNGIARFARTNEWWPEVRPGAYDNVLKVYFGSTQVNGSTVGRMRYSYKPQWLGLI